MPGRKRSRILPVLIALAGEASIVILLSDVVPIAALLLFLGYGFWIPAWFFTDRIFPPPSDGSGAGNPWVLMPIFLPIWAACVVVVWLPAQTFTRMEAVSIVLAAVMASTGLLLWRPVPYPDVDLGRMWKDRRRSAGWITRGLIVCGVFIVLGLSGTGNLSFSAQPAVRNSSFYFLPGQDPAYWDRLGTALTKGESPYIGLGIENREGTAGVYNIVVTQGGDTVIAERKAISVPDGARWEEFIRLPPLTGGERNVVFFLERVGFPWPYLQLAFHW